MRAASAWLLGLATALGQPVWGQTVAMTGHMGAKALLVIDGGPPRAVAAGSTVQGVKVLSVSPTETVVDVAGQRRTVVLGAAPVSLGSASAAEGRGSRIVLSASSGGHFRAQGSINGRVAQFLVDTGATTVALDRAQAQRLGVDLGQAAPTQVQTANGVTVAHRVTLGSLRVGDVELREVEALVVPHELPYVLLGNSFLSRFQMKRENDQLVLERRY
ncbi:MULTISPECIES: retropepsin-like aspartic protease [Caldimonas]|uniref:retropepsin-like aspartic protease family protein n=1 Tax=Caldimonas TaxID=196013 RepID=UPI00038228E6|nr:retropepsin-like aspartic protease [Caldimonas manganoxidans]